ncbi:hypothetical protein SeMB42_g05146 [Synchytrium endobioticum]|uniref:Uncharacterized protein n=1 Tax=Synchytrium endobioticum TaxID=286115 RepID=A0A507D029_9FUNG|nr:hypothetical protein SeMB42_g05146 [Synchytrium endobioticum]TPX44510.1 hypothetical protein SeLEV6574_g04450 [Synchytrium endobioticum]
MLSKRISLAAVLACSMALLCNLPVRGQVPLGDVLKSNSEAMEKYIENLPLQLGLLKLVIKDYDHYIHKCLKPTKCTWFVSILERMKSILSRQVLPWQRFPPEKDFICNISAKYTHYQLAYDDYVSLIADVCSRLDAAEKIETRGSLCTLQEKFRRSADDTASTSHYVFRSTQASTVVMDPRAETLSISFHDGPSIGSAAASNAGVANGGSNLAVGGSGTSALPNYVSDCERLHRRSARFEH